MPKNLVIVESPAKARTIERYLGAGLPRPRLLRPCPRPAREPRQGQVRRRRRPRLRAEYVDLGRPPQAGRRDHEGRQGRRHRLPRHRPRPRGRGDRLARRGGGQRARAQDPAGDLQRDHRGRDPRRVRPSARASTRTSSTPSRPAGSSTASSATRSARCSRARSAAACRPAASSRSPSASSSSASARSRRSPRASTGRSRRSSSTAAGETLRRGARPDRRRSRSTSATATTADRHAAALRDAAPAVTKVGTRKQKRSPAPPFTTSTLQQEASRKLGFSPKRTMSVAQRLYEGVDTPDGHVGLITYMRTDSTAIAGVAMGEARDVIRDALRRAVHDAEGPRLQDEVEGRPGGARVDPPDERSSATRTRSPARSSPRSSASTASSGSARSPRRWRRRSSRRRPPTSRPGRTSCGRARRRRCSTASPRSTPRAATTTRRRGRAERTACRRSPRATSRPSDVTPTQHFTEPPPRFTEATLIKALEEHGIGRPSTYAATISTILDRGYVRVEERRLHPELVGDIVTDLLVEHFGDYVDLEFTARMEEELDEIARGERDWVPLLQAFYPPLRDRVDEVASTRRSDFTTEETDEVCSLGHPMVIRLGRNGRFLACSLYPEHKESRPLPGEEPPPQAGRGRDLPAVRRGHARRQARPVRAVRRLLALPRLRLHQEGGPAAARSARRSRSSARRTTTARSSPRRARRTGNVFWGCSNYPKCDYTTNFEPVGRPRRRRRARREEGRRRDLPEVRRRR